MHNKIHSVIFLLPRIKNADKENGWNDYLNICKVGGTKSFLEIVKIGNLISPFEDGCVESVIGTIENWIDNVDDKSL